MRNFSKHHYKCKKVLTKFTAREETANIKIFTGKPTKQFCLLPWLKSQSTRGASDHPAFMGNCQTVSHKFYSPMYPVDEGNDNVGSVSGNISKNIFKTLQYSVHIETGNHQMYPECSGNITK